MQRKKTIVALLGYGTVNQKVHELLENQFVEVKYILVKELKNLDQRPEKSRKLLTSSFEDILNDDEVQLVFEAISGENPARTYIAELLRKGKSVITANKAAVAKGWETLEEIAKKNKSKLFFEASVGGGIPFVETLKVMKETQEIVKIEGILNGTTNYIMSQMAYENRPYEEALALAQSLGFAEQDPSADVDGIDAANKLCILTAVCFNRYISPDQIKKSSIRGLQSVEAGEKIVSTSSLNACGELKLMEVRKVKYSESHPLYHVKGEENALVITTKNAGQYLWQGPGAGGFPTAHAMILDYIRLKKGEKNESIRI